MSSRSRGAGPGCRNRPCAAAYRRVDHAQRDCRRTGRGEQAHGDAHQPEGEGAGPEPAHPTLLFTVRLVQARLRSRFRLASRAADRSSGGRRRRVGGLAYLAATRFGGDELLDPLAVAASGSAPVRIHRQHVDELVAPSRAPFSSAGPRGAGRSLAATTSAAWRRVTSMGMTGLQAQGAHVGLPRITQRASPSRSGSLQGLAEIGANGVSAPSSVPGSTGALIPPVVDGTTAARTAPFRCCGTGPGRAHASSSSPRTAPPYRLRSVTKARRCRQSPPPRRCSGLTIACLTGRKVLPVQQAEMHGAVFHR